MGIGIDTMPLRPGCVSSNRTGLKELQGESGQSKVLG